MFQTETKLTFIVVIRVVRFHTWIEIKIQAIKLNCVRTSLILSDVYALMKNNPE